MPRMFTRACTRATRVPLRAKRASEPHAPPETRQARTAKLANTHPDKWVEKWYTVYQKAKTYDINEIKGPNAIRDFIHAVGTQFDPTWARAKLVKMIEHNDNLPTDFTLKSIADEFMRYHKATKMFEPSMGIHATLGSRPDTEKAQKSSNKTKKSKF